VLASGAALSRARDDERDRWQFVGEETLRGRGEPTPIAAPSA